MKKNVKWKQWNWHTSRWCNSYKRKIHTKTNHKRLSAVINF